MGNIKLDKNYNVLREKGIYDDDLIQNVELIKKAQSDNVITNKEASFLMKIVLKKEFKNEARAVLPFASEQVPQILSLFMNMKNRQIQHA